MRTFRQASLKDTTDIYRLVESAYRGEASRAGWTTEADLLDGQRTDTIEISCIINRTSNRIILCEENDQLIGSMHIEKKQDYAYLGMFAVRPDCQGKGVGKDMLNYAEELVFKKMACNWLEMSVITQRKDLIGWYQRRGYEVSGKTRPFPYGDTRYGIPRRDDLVLEVLKKRREMANTG